MNPKSVQAKPRILLDLLTYSPTDGGFTTALEDLLLCASKIEEFEFSILYNKHYRGVFQDWPFEKIEVRIFRRKLRYVASLIVVPWILKKHRFDGLHAETSLLSPLLKLPTSMRVHDLYGLMNPQAGRSGILHRVFDNLRDSFFVKSIRRSKVVSVGTECTRRDILKLTDRKGEILRVPYAVNFPDPQPAKRAWPDSSEPIQLLCVGSVVPRKNLGLLFEALPKLNRPWRLNVVGNRWQDIKGVNQDSVDSRVRFLGFVSDSDLRKLYETSHLLISPSLYEGFGFPAAEAIARGCLAVTSSGSAYDEYVPEECRFDPRNSDDLAAIVNTLDAERYARMLEKSQLSVRRYTRARQIAGYRAVFHRLFQEGKVGKGTSARAAAVNDRL